MSLQHITTATVGSLKVPALCIGTWAWGDKGKWGWTDADLDNVKEAWTACTSNGLTFYDTANVYGYGESERIIGERIRSMPVEERSKIMIATKWLPIPSPAAWNIFSPSIVESCKASLKRLGVDSVALYQIHGSIGYFSFASQAKGLAEVVKLGLAKEVGVSNFSKDELIKFCDLMEKHGIKIASNQIEVNLLRTLPFENGLIDEMNKRGIKCLAYSPLAMGRLTGKYSVSNPPPKNRQFSNYPMEKIEPVLEAMRPIAASHNVPLSAVALNWVVAKGAIPLGGARNAKQAEENAKALTFMMTGEEVASLDAVAMKGQTNMWQHG